MIHLWNQLFQNGTCFCFVPHVDGLVKKSCTQTHSLEFASLNTNPTPLMINLFMTNPAARRLQYPSKSGLNKKEREFLIHQEISNLHFIPQMNIYIYTVFKKWAMHWHCLFEGCNHSARIVAKLSGVRTKENLSLCKETCKSLSLLH
jgi:hypothetical protein